MILVSVIVIAIVVSASILRSSKNMKHVKWVRNYAAAQGHRFLSEAPSWAMHVPENCLKQMSRRHRKTFAGLEGICQGLPFGVFTHEYNGYVNDEPKTLRTTFFVVTMPRPLPKINIYPKFDLGPIMAGLAFGVTGYAASKLVKSSKGDFESAEFNEIYSISADYGMDHGRSYKHAFVDPLMMQLLMEPGMKGRNYMINGYFLYRWSNGYLDPETVPAEIGSLVALYRQIPELIWRDYGSV